jgi:uncharacterized protein (TIGR02466 family)
MAKTKVENLFPTMIAKGIFPNANSLNRILLDEIAMFSQQDKMGQQWSKQNYRGGYTSYGSLSDMQFRSPGFSRFADLLQPQVESFSKTLGWKLRGTKLTMNACWFNIMPKHTYHSLHLHPHSVISGAYYVSVPKGSVSLKLEDPRMGLYMNAPVRQTKGMGLYHEVIPRPGSFVLFESWLRHEVPPNQSNLPRISISFNFSVEPISAE